MIEINTVIDELEGDQDAILVRHDPSPIKGYLYEPLTGQLNMQLKNMVVKEEIAHSDQFPPLPLCFQLYFVMILNLNVQ